VVAFRLFLLRFPPRPSRDLLYPWMKEEKGIRHRGEGAYLRCPVSTSVQFSLRNEGSSEYICVCEGRESLRLLFLTALPTLLPPLNAFLLLLFLTALPTLLPPLNAFLLLLFLTATLLPPPNAFYCCCFLRPSLICCLLLMPFYCCYYLLPSLLCCFRQMPFYCCSSLWPSLLCCFL
jgi:hypothetical protein